MAKEVSTPASGTSGSEGDSGLGLLEGVSLIAAMLPGDIVDDDGLSAPSKDEEEQDSSEDDADKTADDAETDADEVEEEEAGSDDEEESEEATDEEVFELTGPDGKTETLTKQQLLEGNLRQADYTRKTQALAEQRKSADAVRVAAEEQRAQYAQQLQMLAEVLKKAQPAEPDWDKLRRDDPAEYSRQYTDWQRHQANQKKVADEQTRVQQEQQEAFQSRLKDHLVAEAEKLHQVLPEMADTAKAKALVGQLVEYGEQLGFSKDDLGQVTDHRLLVLLNKARLFDALQAKKPELRRKIKGSKTTIKPGSREKPVEKVTLRGKKALQKVRKTGRAADAAAAIAGMLSEDVI